MITFGTRPEAIKMIPVYQELKKYPELFEVRLVVTGQHREMLDQVLQLYSITPDVDFDIMSPNQTLTNITNTLQLKFDELFTIERPDLILVHGDTTTALVAAFEAFYHKIKIGHVEAGLRTYDLYNPFPEEANRQLIGRFASLHFAPTLKAKNNLIKENTQGKIWVTGNTGIDTLFLNLKKEYHDPFLENVNEDKIIILTTHRRENIGESMEHIFLALKELSYKWPEYSFIYPIHLNPKIQQMARQFLENISNVHLINPLGVIGFHHYLQKSKLILTDSGGIQEEATALGKPVLILRDTTERPEGVMHGTLKIVGTNKDNIINEVDKLLNNDSYYQKFATAKNPYGDGTASKQIIAALKGYFYSNN
ncbi:UDP-N-acetylglucosamine 2-epimerase (non-hydrolyzing) [Lactococcus lactis]|uniref:non-hydrolyzing UDP-N-acetylglucosamine 2-epimerase n=1 Tax=Lactococcus lactis TaxID=1358 RepID=UPI001913ED1C|nr:UDP-N-acetylglucosamine 2-epimerase (non-hydrolyzing) [Lactococcus lactis]MBK5077544.1 UDP-N-acetylglucosamine 2-epimerase (non-hydrolyzing) [Lactococcus lactis]WDA67353.1 UDP-N-acetylglucosamine 2-epimerase (non-hydrolyzing) [Lactococcus lactis]